MNALTPVQANSLPNLVQRAADALLSAKSSAEVLDARDMARVAYDAAKSAGRMAKVKQAHDSLLSEVYRAQADALLIEATAKIRLADEYDAAQERGEVQKHGGQVPRDVAAPNIPSSSDLGLRRDEIHEARQIRDAERDNPGLSERALTGMIERGEEPTKAALRRETIRKPKPDNDSRALWLWGRLKDFEREGVLSAAPAFLLSQMTDPMRQEVRSMLPKVREFLEEMETLA